MTCEEAVKELATYWEGLGIETSIVKTGGKVEGDWPCVEFLVTFKKENLTDTFPWRCGIGNAKWPKDPFKFVGTSSFKHEEACFINNIKNGRDLKDKKRVAKLASLCTPDSVVNPAEVFARILADMPETNFEEWAENFGYDPNSRKAERTYNLCLEYGFRAQKFVTHTQREYMIELVNML